MLTTLANVCAEFGWPLDYALFLPLPQIFCLSACRAWSGGMEPDGDTYEDRDFYRRLEKIESKNQTKN